MAEIVDVTALKKLNIRPSFDHYLKQIWDRRHFIKFDARARAFSAEREYLLGRFWLLAQPLLDAATYGIIFGLLLSTARGIDNFIGYLIIGITFVGFMTRGLSSGSGLIKSQRNLVRAFNFPRAAIVISRGVRAAIDNALPAVMAVLLALILQGGSPLNLSIIQVLPIYVLVSIFCTGLIFFSARVTAVFPDARVIINFLTRIWFYLSCVFYSIDRFDHAPRIQAVISQNPAYRFVSALRETVLSASWVSWQEWATLIAWSLGTFVVGLFYFWQAEGRYVSLESLR